MGFRSTFTTLDCSVKWPQWFIEKYASSIRFPDSGSGSLHPIKESKTYGQWESLPEDIQSAINWNTFPSNFVLVYLHECGGITRCQIEKGAIKWNEPETWRPTEGVDHSYCYGCSDVK